MTRLEDEVREEGGMTQCAKHCDDGVMTANNLIPSDFMDNAAWLIEDLGRPLPDDPHAVSVCLPTWTANVGYEEGDPAVTGTMRCGYPRFFIHPTVMQLFAAAESRFTRDGECCFVLPSRRVAELAHTAFVEHRTCRATSRV